MKITRVEVSSTTPGEGYWLGAGYPPTYNT